MFISTHSNLWHLSLFKDINYCLFGCIVEKTSSQCWNTSIMYHIFCNKFKEIPTRTLISFSNNNKGNSCKSSALTRVKLNEVFKAMSTHIRLCVYHWSSINSETLITRILGTVISRAGRMVFSSKVYCNSKEFFFRMWSLQLNMQICGWYEGRCAIPFRQVAWQMFFHGYLLPPMSKLWLQQVLHVFVIKWYLVSLLWFLGSLF